MGTFRQFFEAHGDAEQMRRLGLTRGMRIKTPRAAMRHPTEEEIARSQHLVVNAPSSAPPEIRALNGQIVSNDNHQGSSNAWDDFDHAPLNGYVWISALTGRQEEGMSRRVPIAWVYPATGEEDQHGKWLGNTFFQRDKYVSPDERGGLLDLKTRKEEEILGKAFAELEQGAPELAAALKDDYLNKWRWAVAADKLDDIGTFNTADLRKVIH